MEKTDKKIKQAESFCRRLKRLNDDIQAAGFDVYLANSTANIMIGPSHDRNARSLQENSIASVNLRGWDGGDW